MPARTRTLFLLALVSWGVGGCGPAPAPGPDLILTGGRILVDGSPQSVVSALAITADRIAAVGSDDEIRALAGSVTQEMPLDGAVVLPGMYDAWFDIEATGRWADGLDLSDSATEREVLARVRAAAALSHDRWLLGWGWDESVWPRPHPPDAATLDRAVSDRPVVLWHRSLRMAWLNHAAMQQVESHGVSAGRMLDAAGAWNGLLDARGLEAIERVLPAPSAKQRREWLARGLRIAAAAGITAVSSSPLDGASMQRLRALARDGDLAVRVEIRVRPDQVDESVLSDRLPPGMSLGAVGLRLDGPFGSGLAWIQGAATSHEATTDTTVQDACKVASDSGLRLDVQALGDLAVQAALRCASIRDGQGWLVGADLLPAAGIPELGGARIAAVPLRMMHDLYFLADLLGPARLPRAHAYRTLLGNGRLAAFASVSPTYDPAPLQAVRAAWRRRDPQGYPPDGWQPQERISVADALRIAVAPGAAGRSGRLAPGDPADLVIWSDDPYRDPDESLRGGRALLTIVAGRVVFSRPVSSSPG